MYYQKSININVSPMQYTTDLAAPAPAPGEWVQAPPSRPRGYSNMGWY